MLQAKDLAYSRFPVGICLLCFLLLLQVKAYRYNMLWDTETQLKNSKDKIKKNGSSFWVVSGRGRVGTARTLHCWKRLKNFRQSSQDIDLAAIFKNPPHTQYMAQRRQKLFFSRRCFRSSLSKVSRWLCYPQHKICIFESRRVALDPEVVQVAGRVQGLGKHAHFF